MKLRRNDPCHCGSGRKYKQCHLKTDQSRDREQRGLKSGPEWISFHGRSMREAVHGEASTDAAASFFEAPPDAPLADPGFEQHALYDLGDPPAIAGAPLGDDSADQREQLRDTLAETFATLLEVSECKRGKGVRLKDRLTDRELFVGDVELATKLEPMELVLGRLFVFEKRNVLHVGWEKVGFWGRKAVVSQFEQALDGVEDDDRAAWLKREAASLYRAARAAAHPTAP